jgi:ssRNA-specific RNase YbeY (16S rRNA maturation enzyme)
MNAYQNKSDVVRTLHQIDEENEAAYQALYGLAIGLTRHDFIRAKAEQQRQQSTETSVLSIPFSSLMTDELVDRS